jgi:hypothetical protein
VALYAQNKHIVRSLYVVYGVSYIVCAALTFLGTKDDIGMDSGPSSFICFVHLFKDAVVISPNAGECFVQSIPKALAFIFIAPVCFYFHSLCHAHDTEF